MAIFFSVLIIIIPIILIVYSTLKIEFKEFNVINTKLTKLQIIISLNLFNKLKWLKLKIDKQKLNKFKRFYKMLNNKLLKRYKSANKILLNDWKEIIKELRKIEIEKFDLKAEMSTENPAITAYIVTIVSSILAIMLAKKTANPKYIIKPRYIDKNYIYFSVNFIIAIKLIHIIRINNKFQSKESVSK